MPEWLWIICGAVVLGPTAAFAQHAMLTQDAQQVTGKSVESLAGTFRRCAIETRGTAKMWEDLNETGLALLHQNLAVVWQTLCEVESDAPVVIASSPDGRRFTPDELQLFRDKVNERRHGVPCGGQVPTVIQPGPVERVPAHGVESVRGEPVDARIVGEPNPQLCGRVALQFARL